MEGNANGFVKTFFAVAGQVDDVTFTAKAVAEGHAQSLFVFHEQNIFIHCCTSFCSVSLISSNTGKRKVKIVPTPSSLVTDNLPPIASARFLAMGNPNPVPWIWFETAAGLR